MNSFLINKLKSKSNRLKLKTSLMTNNFKIKKNRWNNTQMKMTALQAQMMIQHQIKLMMLILQKQWQDIISKNLKDQEEMGNGKHSSKIVF